MSAVHWVLLLLCRCAVPVVLRRRCSVLLRLLCRPCTASGRVPFCLPYILPSPRSHPPSLLCSPKRYGLVYCGCAFQVWRDRNWLPKSMVFTGGLSRPGRGYQGRLPVATSKSLGPLDPHICNFRCNFHPAPACPIPAHPAPPTPPHPAHYLGAEDASLARLRGLHPYPPLHHTYPRTTTPSHRPTCSRLPWGRGDQPDTQLQPAWRANRSSVL